MTRARDQQRSRVYAAENVVRHAIGDKQFPDKVGLWAYVERVEKDRWFRKHFAFVRNIRIKDGRGRRSAAAYAYSNTITMPQWSRTPMIALHEIAHLCTPGERHGWKYALVYLQLVRHFLGADIHDRLKASFKQHRVRYTKPRPKRQLTDEQRAVMRARLAAIRPQAMAAKQNPGLDVARARGNEASY